MKLGVTIGLLVAGINFIAIDVARHVELSFWLGAISVGAAMYLMWSEISKRH